MSELTILHKRLLNQLKRHSSKSFRAMKDFWFFLFWDLLEEWRTVLSLIDCCSVVSFLLNFRQKCPLKRGQIQNLIAITSWSRLFPVLGITSFLIAIHVRKVFKEFLLCRRLFCNFLKRWRQTRHHRKARFDKWKEEEILSNSRPQRPIDMLSSFNSSHQLR